MGACVQKWAGTLKDEKTQLASLAAYMWREKDWVLWDQISQIHVWVICNCGNSLLLVVFITFPPKRLWYSEDPSIEMD